jgi:hypothetical protein
VKVTRTQEVGFHPRAQCQLCPEKWDQGVETLTSAKRHVAQTGHSVMVTRETLSLYERTES